MERQWSDRTSRSSPALSAPETEERETRLPWMKSNTPEMMLSLRFANGDRRAYPYHDLAAPELMENTLLKLYFVHATVVIQGYNLTELADLIERQCVIAVREQDEFTVPAGAPCISKIGILEPNLAALARKPAG